MPTSPDTQRDTFNLLCVGLGAEGGIVDKCDHAFGFAWGKSVQFDILTSLVTKKKKSRLDFLPS